MDSQQLANKDLIQYRKQREQISFDSVVKKDDENIRIVYKKTHKGYENLDNDNPLELLDSEIDSQKRKPEDQTEGSYERTGSRERTSSGERPEYLESYQPLNDPATEPLNFSSEIPVVSESNPNQTDPVQPLPVGSPRSSSDKVADNATETNEDTQSPQKSTVTPTSILKNRGKVTLSIDLDDIKVDKTGIPIPQAIPTSPLPSPPSSPTPHQAGALVWSGRIIYQWKGYDFDLMLNAFHINGPNVGSYLPRVMKIEQRISLDQLIKYVPKIDFSSSRKRTCVYFEISDKGSEGDKKTYRKLFAHLKKINRGGVFAIRPDELIGVDSSFFKELYIFPLGASDNVPPFLGDEYDRDLEDMLIGIFLTNRSRSHITLDISGPIPGEPSLLSGGSPQQNKTDN